MHRSHLASRHIDVGAVSVDDRIRPDPRRVRFGRDMQLFELHHHSEHHICQPAHVRAHLFLHLHHNQLEKELQIAQELVRVQAAAEKRETTTELRKTAAQIFRSRQ